MRITPATYSTERDRLRLQINTNSRLENFRVIAKKRTCTAKNKENMGNGTKEYENVE